MSRGEPLFLDRVIALVAVMSAVHVAQPSLAAQERPSIDVSPAIVPLGMPTRLTIRGSGFAPGEQVYVYMLDAERFDRMVPSEGAVLGAPVADNAGAFVITAALPRFPQPARLYVVAYAPSFGPQTQTVLRRVPRQTVNAAGPNQLPPTGTGAAVVSDAFPPAGLPAAMVIGGILALSIVWYTVRHRPNSRLHQRGIEHEIMGQEPFFQVTAPQVPARRPDETT